MPKAHGRNSLRAVGNCSKFTAEKREEEETNDV